MARGRPGVWSTILGLPILFTGSWVHNGWTLLPELVGLPIALFGAFIIGMGWYVHLVAAPEGPTMRDDEELVDTRHPTQKGAIARILIGSPILVVAAGLLFYTTLPYIYPTIAFVVGTYLLGRGLTTYWTNTLTTYYVTTERVMSEFRLLSLVRREVPLEKVRAVEETRSPIESLVGVGNVRVSTGGSGLMVMIRSIDDVGTFAEELKQLT